MSAIHFCKFQGFGNDYIVVDQAQLGKEISVRELASAMCDRHKGIGADGLAVIGRSEGAESDFTCRIINPDGSEAGFSGNGTRCAVAYVYFKDLWTRKELRLKTLSGIKNYTLQRRDNNTFWYLAELGKPKFAAAEIPFIDDTEGVDKNRVVDRPLQAGVRSLEITCVNIGNPVCVVFVDDFGFNWRRVGAKIESHPKFPERVNTVFVKVKDRKNLETRNWERGAGETSSSGTCSIGAAVAAAFTGRADREVDVKAPGGVTKAIWRKDGEMLIEGRADLVFCGEWPD